jgi:hypothetical protein
MRNPVQRLIVRVLEAVLGKPPQSTPRVFRLTLEEWDLDRVEAEQQRIRAILEEEQRIAALRVRLQTESIKRGTEGR